MFLFATRLELYPTVHHLICIFLGFVSIQLGWLLFFWFFRSDRLTFVQKKEELPMEEHDKIPSIIASPRRRNRRIDINAFNDLPSPPSIPPKSPSRRVRRTFFHTHHWFVWYLILSYKRLNHLEFYIKILKKAVLWTFFVLFAQIIQTSALLYLRTGSFLEKPYEWYGLEATGERLYGPTSGNELEMPLPTNILDTCLPKSSVSSGSFLTLDQVQIQLKSRLEELHQNNQTIIVYVAPIVNQRVLSLTERQLVPNQQPQELQLLRGGQSRDMESYERIEPVEEVTLFPFVWNFLLGNGFDSRVEASKSPYQRNIQGIPIEFHLLKDQKKLEQLESTSAAKNLLVITQWMPEMISLVSNSKLDNFAFMALAREDCHNPQYTNTSNKLKFAFIPYGDCSLPTMTTIPLGPSFEHGFPLNAHLKKPMIKSTKRPHLLNLMVSWTQDKPTRIQALMAANQVCANTSKACIIEHGDLVFKILQKIDQWFLGGKGQLRWLLSNAPTRYMDILSQSIFTLCPMGKNPEQYRIWEALAAGSIPIIEDLDLEPGQFFHPAYPKTWKCRPKDQVHYVLKQFKAPVLYVKNWDKDLPKLMEFYSNPANAQVLNELQDNLHQWYLQMAHHFQAKLIQQALIHFTT